VRFADMRPFITADDADLTSLVDQSRKKACSADLAQAAGSIVLGTTDPTLLSRLDGSFAGALFLAPASSESTWTGSSAAFREAALQGLRRRNAASVRCGGGLLLEEAPPQAAATSRRSSAKATRGSLLDAYNQWMAANGGGKARTRWCPADSMLVCRSEPTGYPVAALLQKIRHMAPAERCVLGDMLLRDSLRELTMGFLLPATNRNLQK
jgi:hypothetical protein